MSRYIFKRKSNRFQFSYFLPLAIIITGSATLLEYVEKQENPTSRIQSESAFFKDVSLWWRLLDISYRFHWRILLTWGLLSRNLMIKLIKQCVIDETKLVKIWEKAKITLQTSPDETTYIFLCAPRSRWLQWLHVAWQYGRRYWSWGEVQ